MEASHLADGCSAGGDHGRLVEGRFRRPAAGDVDAVSLSLVEEDLVPAQVDHVGQSGVAEPAGDFVEGMPRHVSGSIPVEGVAHADLGIGVHRDADGRQVEGDAQPLDQARIGWPSAFA